MKKFSLVFFSLFSLSTLSHEFAHEVLKSITLEEGNCHQNIQTYYHKAWEVYIQGIPDRPENLNDFSLSFDDSQKNFLLEEVFEIYLGYAVELEIETLQEYIDDFSQKYAPFVENNPEVLSC